MDFAFSHRSGRRVDETYIRSKAKTDIFTVPWTRLAKRSISC